MLLEGMDEDEDARGYGTLENMESCNIKSAIYNWADAWKEVAVRTLASFWQQALLDADPDSPTDDDFEGLEPGDFHHTVVSGNENEVSGTDIDGWLEADEGQRGYQTVTKEDTTETASQSAATDGDDDGKDTGTQREELSVIRDYCENIIKFIELSLDATLSIYNEQFRAFRYTVTDRQRKTLTQRKIPSCFKPVKSAASPSGSNIPSNSAAEDVLSESPDQLLERLRFVYE